MLNGRSNQLAEDKHSDIGFLNNPIQTKPNKLLFKMAEDRLQNLFCVSDCSKRQSSDPDFQCYTEVESKETADLLQVSDR